LCCRIAYRPDGWPLQSGSAQLPLSLPPERSISGFHASFLDPACAVIDAELTIVYPAPSQSPRQTSSPAAPPSGACAPDGGAPPQDRPARDAQGQDFGAAHLHVRRGADAISLGAPSPKRLLRALTWSTMMARWCFATHANLGWKASCPSGLFEHQWQNRLRLPRRFSATLESVSRATGLICRLTGRYLGGGATPTSLMGDLGRLNASRCETRGQAEHLKVWRSNATSDVGSPRSSTCISRISAPQAKHFIAVPPGYRPEIERQGLIVSSVSNHVAFTAMTCVLDARILRVTIGGGAASSHERPRAPFTA